MSGRIPISAEFQVLLAACDPKFECFEPAGSFDWARLHELSEVHGVLPLVHDYLQRCGLSARIPEATHSEAQEYAKRQLRLSAVLLRLLERFVDAGIPIVPFKGPALSQQLYGNIALRQSTDLDLLVAREQVDDAVRVLGDAGFVAQDEFSNSQRALMRRSHCEIDFYSREWDVTVELHWAILPPEFGVKLPTSGGLRETQPLSLCGKSVSILRPEENVLALAAHATKHCWNRVLYLADLARAISYPGLDYERVSRLAKESGCFGMLAFGLELCSRLFRDRELSRAFPLSSSAKKYVEITIAKLNAGEVQDAGETSRHKLYLALMDDRRQAARYCWRVIANPQPADLARLDLPRRLTFLYPAVRSVRLASKAVRALMPAR